MTLGAQVINLVGADGSDQFVEGAGVGQVIVGKAQTGVGIGRLAEDVKDASGAEGALAADDAVDLVALGKQQLGQIRSVLARNPGYERFFSHDAGVFTLLFAPFLPRDSSLLKRSLVFGAPKAGEIKEQVAGFLSFANPFQPR